MKECHFCRLEEKQIRVHKLLEAPEKVSWWKRLGGGGAKAAVVALLVLGFIVGVGAAEFRKFGVPFWQVLNKHEKAIFLHGYGNGFMVGSVVQEQNPMEPRSVLKCTQEWSAEKQAAIVDKYLQENPDKRDKPFSALVYLALKEACNKR